MRTRPHTTARLYRWVRPKRNPMANVIKDDDRLPPEDETEETGEEENEGENENEGDENETEGKDTLVDSWEAENERVFELHGIDDHDEVLVIEEADETPGSSDDHTVAIAFSVEDIDEAIDILKEIRVEMVNRAQAKKAAKVRAPARRKP